jgi:hypothetical protein
MEYKISEKSFKIREFFPFWNKTGVETDVVEPGFGAIDGSGGVVCRIK